MQGYQVVAVREVPTLTRQQYDAIANTRPVPQPVDVAAYRAEVGPHGQPNVVSETNLLGFMDWTGRATPEELDIAYRCLAVTHHRQKVPLPDGVQDLTWTLGGDRMRHRYCTEHGCEKCRVGVEGPGAWHFRWVDPRWTCSFAIARAPYGPENGFDKYMLGDLARRFPWPWGLLRPPPGA